MCQSSSCTNEADRSTCCRPLPTCDHHQCSAEYVKKPDASMILCTGKDCNSKEDDSRCCMPRQTCTSSCRAPALSPALPGTAQCVKDEVTLSMAHGAIVNNLGGSGTNLTADDVAEEIRIQKVAKVNGEDVDLVVTVEGVYRPHKPNDNGIRDSLFMVINVATDTDHEFKFTFVKTGTNTAIKLSKFVFSVMDMDTASSNTDVENVKMSGFSSFKVPKDDIDLLAVQQEDTDAVLLTARGYGLSCDNPNSLNLKTVDCGSGKIDQAKRVVSFIFEDKSNFTIKTSITNAQTGTGRNFIFGPRTSALPKCDSNDVEAEPVKAWHCPKSYTPKSHIDPKTGTARLCGGEKCTEDDLSACCIKREACSLGRICPTTHIIKTGGNNTTALCAGPQCSPAAGDLQRCCIEKAKCTSYTCPEGKRPVLTPDLYCAGTKCKKTMDESKCCESVPAPPPEIHNPHDVCEIYNGYRLQGSSDDEMSVQDISHESFYYCAATCAANLHCKQAVYDNQTKQCWNYKSALSSIVGNQSTRWSSCHCRQVKACEQKHETGGYPTKIEGWVLDGKIQGLKFHYTRGVPKGYGGSQFDDIKDTMQPTKTLTFNEATHETIVMATVFGANCQWEGIEFETSEGRNMSFGEMAQTAQKSVYTAASCDHIIGFLFPQNRNCKPDGIISGPKLLEEVKQAEPAAAAAAVECPEESVRFGCGNKLCATDIKECNLFEDPLFSATFSNSAAYSDPARFGVQTLMRSVDGEFEIQGYMCPYNAGLGAAKTVNADGSLSSDSIGTITGGVAIKTKSHIITMAGASSNTAARITIDGHVVGQTLTDLSDGSVLNTSATWQECLNIPEGLSIKRVATDPLKWNYKILADAGLPDNQHGLCNSAWSDILWADEFGDSTPGHALFDNDTLAWLEQDCQIDPTMLDEVAAGTVAEPRTPEVACESNGIKLTAAKEHCADLTSESSRALCEVQYCSDNANKDTVLRIAAATSDEICETTFMASQVCTPYYDYKLYGSKDCQVGEIKQQSSWPECMNSCILTSGCKQAVWEQIEKTCALYVCASLEDEDGAPGQNMNYVSAVCHMEDELRKLEAAAVEANKLENRLQPE